MGQNSKELFVSFNYSFIQRFIGSVSDSVSLFIACQFALESDFGRSSLARDHNNFCGMKKPLVRPSTCLKTDCNGFASYKSQYMCVVDYFLCISYHRPMSQDLEDVEKYARFIKKFYCPERYYIEKIMSIYNQFTYLLTKNQQNEK